MRTMLTSIYGTVYNNARIIGKCLSSLAHVLPAFNDNYELVVVDNYSTDGTFEILMDFAKEYKNVKLFRAKCTRGKGRDIALKNTSGDYVFYVDFDNIFEREFRIIIEKFKKLCTQGTLWWPYGFSTRDTSIEMIGGWKNLNHSEDREFNARAIAKGLNVKQVCIPKFYLADNVRLREARYTKGFVSHWIRKFRNIIDSMRGCNFDFTLLKEDIIAGKFFSPSCLVALTLFPISKSLAFKYDEKLSNFEFIYKNIRLLFPEDIELPSDWFLIVWDHVWWTWHVIKERIKELIERDKNLKLMLFKKSNRLICTRNPHLVEKYLFINADECLKINMNSLMPKFLWERDWCNA